MHIYQIGYIKDGNDIKEWYGLQETAERRHAELMREHDRYCKDLPTMKDDADGYVEVVYAINRLECGNTRNAFLRFLNDNCR